jgi:two-component system, cell cycle sensor histidine kinase and response regulator CckA
MGAPTAWTGDELLQTVFEQAPLGMAVFDRQWRIVRANSALAHMLGTDPSALSGRSIVELTHPEDRLLSAEPIRRLERKELTWISVQHRFLRDDGGTSWGEYATRIFWDADGGFLHALAIVRDVGETVRAEAALRESEIRNWRIAESNMMGLFEWRDDVTISEANDAFLQIVGFTRDDLRASRIRWEHIIPPGWETLVARMRTEFLKTGRLGPTRMEYRKANGDLIPVLAGAARLSWEPVRGIGFVLDMSEQRKIEDQRAKVEAALRDSLVELKQAQTQLQLADRMASMGTLAAGVAHEINNPLAFVVANLGFAQEEVRALRASPPDPLQMDKRLAALTWALGEAQEGAARVRNIVLDLRVFSHPDAELRGAVDVRRVIDSALNLAQGEIRGRARIVRRFEAVPPVLGNEARLSQLFLNLIVNAAHSIPVIASAGLDDDTAGTTRHEIRISVWQSPEGQVVTEVTDSGIGIPPEHLDRIFDPFFTTKPVGLGTGLGLSICHGIVRSLGGEISVTSAPGTGSSFRVSLPGAKEDALPVQPPRSSSQARYSRRARVLVVDDEPLMGSAIARLLSEHEVVPLTSARIAMARIAAGERFDVILCDVMMPDFSGMELYDGIARHAPELLSRLVFVTGGAYTTDAIEFLDRIPNPRLEKPIPPETLHNAVSLVLDAADWLG